MGDRGMSRLDELLRIAIKNLHAELVSHGCKFAIVIHTSEREKANDDPIVAGTGDAICISHLLVQGLERELDGLHEEHHDLEAEAAALIQEAQNGRQS